MKKITLLCIILGLLIVSTIYLKSSDKTSQSKDLETGLIADPITYWEKSEKCPKDRPFSYGEYIKDDYCAGCDNIDSMEFDPKKEYNFDICINREIVDWVSYLKECPEGMIRLKKECYSCSKLEWVNDNLFDMIYTSNNKKEICSLCNFEYDSKMNKCIKKKQ